MQAAADKRKKRGVILILVLAVAGLLFSAELLRIHITVGHEPDHSFACRINEQVDCNAVAQSRQAVFLDVPVPVWGVLNYLVFAGLAVAGLASKKEPYSEAGDYALPLSLWSVGYSAYLAYVSAFELKIFCAYCVALYVVNLALLVASFQASSPVSGWIGRRSADFKWMLQNPVRLGVVGFLVVTSLSAAAVLYVRSSRGIILESGGGIEIDVTGDPMVGPYRAPVTIIEFSDYECPACRRMHQIIEAVLEEYKGSVRLFHKNFPLDSSCNPEMPWAMHPRACDAAFAAECAFKMGKFEDYSKWLWTAEDLSVPALVKRAGEEGLDPGEFEQCMSSDEIRRAVLEDIEAGTAVEVTATPTFIVNGYKFTGYSSIKSTSRLIERALKGNMPAGDQGP